MSACKRFSNCLLVCRHEVVNGTLTVKDGNIEHLDDRCLRGSRSPAFDCEGDFLLPGLIELHTDNLEKHLVPRPGVVWPSPLSAVLAHDAQIIHAGITTVLDAVCIGAFLDEIRPRLLHLSIEAIEQAGREALLRADHLLHLRCEIADPDVIAILQPHQANPLVRLVSVMDHTPGQRQWMDLEKYRTYHKSKNWSDKEFAANISTLREQQQLYAEKNRITVREICRQLFLPLASHDDTLTDHVDLAFADGAMISEFPTTRQAAGRARELGMRIIAGAPNLLRGQSHSGNVSAAELAKNNLLDGMSSDYVPASLLPAAFSLHHDFSFPLHDAVAQVSANIADMLALHDRGEIAPGKRADLVRVRLVNGSPVVRAVWRQGERVC